MSSSTKEPDGRFTSVPHFFWNTKEAADVLWQDAAVQIPSSKSEGRVVVRKSEVIAFCLDGEEGLRNLHMQSDTSTSSRWKKGLPLTSERRYEPPYLSFLWQAAAELNLTPDERRPKEEIETWLRSNWPDHLPSASRQKIASMATILRHPTHERGGLLKIRKPLSVRSSR